MGVGGVTWIDTADAVGDRNFTGQTRARALRELPESPMAATDAERGAGRRQRATERASVGSGRHGAGRGDFGRLALMGPPRALGTLKQALAPAIAARVDVTDPHERKNDDPELLRRQLRQARARTAS